MTTNDILNLDIGDIMKLDKTTLKEYVKTLGHTQRNRLRNFTAEGIHNSPAVRRLNESGGNISTKGKNLNQLRAEFKRAVNFLKDTTSTQRGFTAFKNKIKTRSGYVGDNIKEFGDRTLDVFLKLRNDFPLRFSESGSEEYKAVEYEVAHNPRYSNRQIEMLVADKLWGLSDEYTVNEEAYENEDFQILNDEIDEDEYPEF